ncbi:MAG: response regulator [Polyangiaceae bacterium]
MFEFHEAPTQPANSRRKPIDGEAALVLIVDDDEDARAIYRVSLEQFGYRTASEACGEDGVATAAREHPVAVLMDAEMPGIGGLEATKRIKADPLTHDCQVIVVTAGGTSHFDAARRAGCDAYFCKPFNAFALDTVIRTLTTPGDGLPPPRSSGIVKECRCGETYVMDGWLALRLCGRMHVTDAPHTTVELRNCVCGSTLALAVEVS